MKYLLSFLVLCLIACSGENSTDIVLYNQKRIKVMNDEKRERITTSLHDRYAKYFNTLPSAQLPLSKYIKHKDYEIFIAIPYNTDFNNLKKEIKEAGGTVNSTDTSCFRQFEADGNFFSEYAVASKDSSIIFIGAVTNQKNVCDSLLNESMLIKRIQ
jgi:hypothetical protein